MMKMRNEIIFSRCWAMPSSDTFSIKPINEFVRKWLIFSTVSCDPFARNSKLATYTNDLNPNTLADYHMDAEEFINALYIIGIKCDALILDPPYSPRQISECYRESGIPCGMTDTQNASLYTRVKRAALKILTDDCVVLSFGWNSTGIGKKQGFEIIEQMNVCHGAAHNDTICIAEKRSNVNP